MAQKSDVLAIVKLRLNLDDQQDGIINSYIDEVGARIMHYCNLSEIPEALNHTWASIVQHLVFYVQKAYDGESDGKVSAVNVGDTQVTESQVNKIISPAVSNAMIDGIILNFKADLNRYRKLRW